MKHTKWYTAITFNSNRSANISVPTHLLILSASHHFFPHAYGSVKKGGNNESPGKRLATMQYSNKLKKAAKAHETNTNTRTHTVKLILKRS